MDSATRLLRLTHAAKAFDLPVRWLKNEAIAGRLPCLRVGRRIYFDRHALENALARRAAQGFGATSASP
jgi:hypothetical protein